MLLQFKSVDAKIAIFQLYAADMAATVRISVKMVIQAVFFVRREPSDCPIFVSGKYTEYTI
jgi:hypothetical protein